MLKKKIVLITGGTGSFGSAVLKKFLDSGVKEIRIFSRDEKKQDDLRKKYNNSKLKFYIGDVRDYQSVLNCVRGCDFIFHAAALKQVPSCEFHPMEAVKTNILGTEHVLEAAINCEVARVIVLSTDKAVYPINAMGISKAMMEKVAIQKSRTTHKTVINITRYGNVMGSRGSVIPLFIKQILDNRPITITDPDMTRFMMSLEDAVDLVLYAFKHGKNGEIFVQKSPATDIKTLVSALKKLLNISYHPTIIIGTRHGEKLFEVLLSREEMVRAKESKDYYYVSPDTRDLNYTKFIDKGEKKISKSLEYNSHNTHHLVIKKMQSLLMKQGFIKKIIKDNKKFKA
ncbi:polysaccharide biosynthesis protein [Candidatus Pelagibacter sp.]|nr:polysaccharide biosynthesis protein [Candidatus Pelagibacter sp.]